jgi:hypothetical protein
MAEETHGHSNGDMNRSIGRWKETYECVNGSREMRVGYMDVNAWVNEQMHAWRDKCMVDACMDGYLEMMNEQIGIWRDEEMNG